MSINRSSVLTSLRKVLPGSPGIGVIHSSLVHLGPPSDFSEWDILWALKVLCREGWTFVFPSFTFSFCDSGHVDLDVTNSETGMLANWVMSVEGAIRTRDPIYSCVLLGPKAFELLDKEDEDPFGKDSLFFHLDSLDAQIIMFGAEMNTCTIFHLYEYLSEVPYRYAKRFSGTIKWRGKRLPVSSVLKVRDAEIAAENNFSDLIESIERDGEVRVSSLWRGFVRVFSASSVRKVALKLLESNPYALVRDAEAVFSRFTQLEQAKKVSSFNVALLGNANLETIKGHLIEKLPTSTLGRNFEIITLAFGQLAQQQVAWAENLLNFRPDLGIFCATLEDLLVSPGYPEIRAEIAYEAAEEYGRLIRSYSERFGGRTLVFTFPPARRVTVAKSQAYSELLSECNNRVRNLLQGVDGIIWVDTAVEAALADNPIYDSRLWQLAKIPFSDGFSRRVASICTSVIADLAGKSIRAIVVDLDNTLWGGVLGEDGLGGVQIGGDFPGSAYSHFQQVLLDLKRTGIVLAISSKNDSGIVEAMFRENPQMILKLDDFSALQVNWNRKSRNIKEIAELLNLGLDSILFIDDNPVERNEVASELPGIHILDLPSDPSLYSETLLAYPYLWAGGHTVDSVQRDVSYKVLAQLKKIEGSPIENQQEFLDKLGMVVHFESLNTFNLDRATQLCQKTNQFNTTTKRYSSNDLLHLIEVGADVVVVGLEDRFLSKENIGLIVLKQVEGEAKVGEVDLLLLSCRVLGRGIEHVLIDWALARAQQRKWTSLRGSIVETPRNTPVREIFAHNQFRRDQDNFWHRDAEPIKPRKGFGVVDGFGPWK